MKIYNMIRFMIAPALFMMLFTGCVKRNITPPTGTDGYANIALDWGEETHPNSAQFLFYNESGELVKEAKGITDSFRVLLPAGTYNIIVRNENAINVDYRGMDNYATAEVFALAEVASNKAESFIKEPQQVFGTGVCKEFKQLVIQPNKTTVATAAPKLLTRKVDFIFKVTGEITVRSLEGILTGVTPGVFLATGLNNTTSSRSLEFSASPRSKAAELEFIANIGVFNLNTTAESEAGTNTINITLTENSGMEHSTTVDLTEVLKEIIGNNGGVIPITIPVEVILEVKAIGLTSIVRPWDNSGSGSGNPLP